MTNSFPAPLWLISPVACFNYRVTLSRASSQFGRSPSGCGYRSPGSVPRALGGVAAATDSPAGDLRWLGERPVVLEAPTEDRTRWWRWIGLKLGLRSRLARVQRETIVLGRGFGRFVDVGDALQLERSIVSDLTLTLWRGDAAILCLQVSTLPAMHPRMDDLMMRGGAIERAAKSGERVVEGEEEYRVVAVDLAPVSGEAAQAWVLCKAIVGSGAESIVDECAHEYARGMVTTPWEP